MTQKSSPPPLTPEDFSGLLAAHRQWERSGGQEGQRADLSVANLEGLDLDGYDLSHLDFREANFARVKFGDAHVEGTNFRAADLREADLSGTRGLLTPQLAGADLAGTRLPEGRQEFAGLKHVDAASGHVQKIFFLLLLVCVYCWLTIAVTTDGALLNNFAETPLPIINTKINLVMFYWAAPFLLLCVYLYFHLCLQRLWEALAGLPAVFPDGLPLPRRVHPWLWNGLVWAYSPRLRDRRPPLLGLQKILAIFLVWWAGPLILLGLWNRYLPAHHWPITILQLLFLTLAMDAALGFSLLTRATLRLKESQLSLMGKGGRKRIVQLLLTTVCIAAMFSILSQAAIEGLGGRPWAIANITEADVSLKPPQWTGSNSPEEISHVRGAFLRGRNLRGAKAVKAFLVKADLSFANLQEADLTMVELQRAFLPFAHLEQADLLLAQLEQANLSRAYLQHAKLAMAQLQHANLGMANLEHANLLGAELQHANLAGANLQHANLFLSHLQHAKLSGADFQYARGLQREQVMAASCWPLAKYSKEMLDVLQLPPEHNENLDKENLSYYQLPRADLRGAFLTSFNLLGANLQGANLKGADLRQAKGLTRDQLKSAIIDEKTQLPDDLKDLVPSGSKKP